MMTFDEWFRSKQGEPYDSMYVFARDAWAAAIAAEREACAKVCDESARICEQEDGETTLYGQIRAAQSQGDAIRIRARSNRSTPCRF